MSRLSPEEKSTIETYDMIASDWVSEHSSKNFWEAEITRFRELKPTGKLLEIGSGGGRDAKLLSGLGYDYVGTDITHNLILEARKYNPELLFTQSSIYDLPFSDGTFDSFWASAVLLHIPKSKIDAGLQELSRVCRQDALGFIAIKEGNDEKVEWDNRFFAYYTQNEFTQKLLSNNFNIKESNIRMDSPGTTWLTYLTSVVK